jgi:hypothetical protein
LKTRAQKLTVHNSQTGAPSFCAQTNKNNSAPKTDQEKTDAKKDRDPNEVFFLLKGGIKKQKELWKTFKN